VNSRNSAFRFLAAAVSLLLALGLTAFLFGQDEGVGPGWATSGRISLPTDWSTKHVIYTGNFKGSSPQAAMAEQVSKSHYDPRLFNSWLLQGHLPPGQSAKPAAKSAPAPSPAKSTKPSGPPTTSKGPAPTRDWALSLGTAGGVAPNMYPAKFSFNINAAPDCINDYLVFGLNAAGSATQANLVGVNELYSGASPVGLCGTAPNVYWAYNVTTLSGGKITTSPTLSLDGTEIAFVESNGTASVLHVLKWLANNGTVTAPVKPTAVTSVAGCTAPCMVSLEYDSSHGTTLSSPYYDYQNDDAIYVGNDNGKLFKILGVFGGTPAVDTASGWSSAGLTLGATGIKMTGPIWDINSGNVFIGGSDGKLYAVNGTSPGTPVSIAIGSGSANGGGIVDAPIVDSSSGTVYAFAAANAAGIGNATANKTAVTLQAKTATPFTSPQVATIGQGTLGTQTGLNVAGGSFDNGYYSWSGSGANTGNLYMIGTAASAAYPTLYQLPFSGIGSVTVTGTGGGYSKPAVSITDSTGTNATLTGSGGVTGVNLSTLGSGYTSIPTATFGAAPTGGTTASGAAVSVGVNAISVTAAGSGYTSAGDAVTIGGSGSGGTADVSSLGVASVAVSSGGSGYTAVPTATATGGSTNATLAASVGTSTVNVTAGGSYTTLPTASFTGGGTGTTQVGVNTIAVSAGGSNYAAPPSLTINGSGAGGGAATGVLGVDAASISAGGTYTAVPTVAFPGGTTSATGSALVGLLSIGVTAGGSFTALPSITIGGTGSGGSATPSVGVTAVGVTSGGSGYTSVPAVSFAGTGSPNAAATASLGVSSISLAGAGSGYTSVPTVSFSGTPTTAATATATLDVVSLGLTAGGSGYTAFPTVGFSGGTPTTAATATATVGIATVAVAAATTTGTMVFSNSRPANGGTTTVGSITYVYEQTCGSTAFCITTSNTSATTNATNFKNAINGNCGGAACTANASATATSTNGTATVTNITGGSIVFSDNSTNTTISPTGGALSNNGSAGCTNGTQSLTFSGTGGSGASGTATIASGVVTAVSLTAGGSGYSTFPAFTVATCSTQPTTRNVTATITGLSLTSGGAGYNSVPSVTFSGAGGSGSSATANLGVASLTLTGAGSGYTAVPTVSFSGSPTTAATATDSLKVVSVAVTTAGSYTTFPTATISGATVTTTVTIESVAVATAGSYSTYPTAVSAPTGATLSVTAAKVVGVTVATAGTGYTSGPISLTFGTSGGSGAAATADLKVVSVSVTSPGSYTTFPTATITGNATLGAVTATVVGVTVTAPGSSSTYPTVTFSGSGGATATVTSVFVTSVAVSAPGTGYTAVPTVSFSGSPTTAATAAASMGVSTVSVTAPGSYTTFPSASITSVFGGSGTTLTLKAEVVGVAAPSTPGSGYTAAPTVTFSTAGGSGAAASSTINVSAINVTYGGGGYTAPTVTITDTGTGSGATATANVNAGTVMTPGVNSAAVCTAATPTTCYQIDNSTPPEPASPLSEIYNPSITPPGDLLFYTFGTSSLGVVYSQPVTSGAISTAPASYSVSGPGPGTGGIIVDNVSSASQASSIYFGTLGTYTFGTEPVVDNVTSASSSGSDFNSTNTATVTLAENPTGFQVNQTVTVVGVSCSPSGEFYCSNESFNGSYTILTISGATITYDIATCALFCFNVTGSGGTATATENVTDYAAIKLTQSALQ
jgi:hypothetical protein